MPRQRQRHRATPSAAPPPSLPLLSPTLEDQLRRLRSEFPFIRPFAEEDDEHWWNDGLDALKANRLPAAAQIFKKLALAQPEHFDGYYGLAQVYHRQGQLALALLFADEAVRRGQAFIDDGTLDPSTMVELKAFRLKLGPLPGSAL